MPITFADFDLESQRQRLNFEWEKHDEQSRYDQQNHRRRASGNYEVIGAAARDGRGNKKPNTFSIRQGPPAKDQNSLRNLSICSLVQLTRGSQMLLQDNAHAKLEQQRCQSDNYVRRKLIGLKRNSKNGKKLD